jgi:Protein of unknown function (DUF3667)
VSHIPLRKEKDCLNCGAMVHGRYCHICGQENVVPKESFGHLIKHFFYDITHFDGKFFETLKHLITRPGFLTKEYGKGRRAGYLNPIKMYVFTSAFFFLIFFSFMQPGEIDINSEKLINNKTFAEIEMMDSVSFAKFTAAVNLDDKKQAGPMTREAFGKYKDSLLQNSGLMFTGKEYKSKKEYDSILALGIKKHNWAERQLIYKQIALNEKYHNNKTEIINAFKNKLLHTLPQLFFISLPFLALLLKLLYIRRKEFYYVNHGIFSVHLYIFLFISFLVLFGISRLNEELHVGVLSFISSVLIFSLFLYEYLALKNYYRQGWFKTFIKFFLLNILFVFVLSILFIVFTFFSLFNI